MCAVGATPRVQGLRISVEGRFAYPLLLHISGTEIGDIAIFPSRQWYAQTGFDGLYTSWGDLAKWVAYEVRDGVGICVIYEPATLSVITPFPDNGSIPAYEHA